MVLLMGSRMDYITSNVVTLCTISRFIYIAGKSIKCVRQCKYKISLSALVYLPSIAGNPGSLAEQQHGRRSCDGIPSCKE